MKRFVLILFAIFTCVIANAEQITINWLNEDKTINQTTTCTVGGDVVLPNNIPQKRGYTFKGYVDNYTPVEYIEGTGSQWIDTGYRATNNTRVKTQVYISSIVANRQAGLFGFYSGFQNSFSLLIDTNKSLYMRFWLNGVTVNMVVNTGDILTIDYNKNSLSVDLNGVEYSASIVSSTFTCPNNVAIFRCLNDTPVASMKLYYFQIYNNDVLVRDFIPVVDSKGVACLYDRVEHKFYYNAGSGEFIAGPEIQ